LRLDLGAPLVWYETNKTIVGVGYQQQEEPWLMELLLLFIAQVPAVMMDRFARINHGFDDSRSCSSFALDKPKACLAGSADSQSAAAWEQLISNLLCFFLNTLVGSISDQYGRKSKLPYIVMYRLMQYLISHFIATVAAILIPGLFVASLQPLCLVLLQLHHRMDPIWYYAAGSATGLIGWVSVTLSALSDVVRK
jgi:MFS family permease